MSCFVELQNDALSVADEVADVGVNLRVMDFVFLRDVNEMLL